MLGSWELWGAAKKRRVKWGEVLRRVVIGDEGIQEVNGGVG